MIKSVDPWPLREILSRLQGEDLYRVVSSRRPEEGRLGRERILESIVHQIAVANFGAENVWTQRESAGLLKIERNRYPGLTKPDLIVRRLGQFHICEVKANRGDYTREESVFDSKQLKAYLNMNGGWRESPDEIEQDLVKLIAFGDEPTVGSRLLMLLDCHFTNASSWAQVLINEDMLRSRASTALVRSLAGKIASQTQTVLIGVGEAQAALVVVDVPSMDEPHEEEQG